MPRARRSCRLHCPTAPRVHPVGFLTSCALCQYTPRTVAGRLLLTCIACAPVQTSAQPANGTIDCIPELTKSLELLAAWAAALASMLATCQWRKVAVTRFRRRWTRRIPPVAQWAGYCRLRAPLLGHAPSAAAVRLSRGLLSLPSCALPNTGRGGKQWPVFAYAISPVYSCSVE